MGLSSGRHVGRRLSYRALSLSFEPPVQSSVSDTPTLAAFIAFDMMLKVLLRNIRNYFLTNNDPLLGADFFFLYLNCITFVIMREINREREASDIKAFHRNNNEIEIYS